jgi:hypothetical protein
VLGNKKRACILNSIYLLKCVSFVDKQENHCHMPWEKKVKLLWVFKVSNCPIAYAIGAEFHHVNHKVKLDFIGIY